MEENNQLAEMNEVFNNQTLTYRINGFAKACGMNNLFTAQRINKQVLFNKRKKDSKEENYYIVVNPSIKEDGITISGYYGDLNFAFSNYYSENDDLDSDIVDLPFSISLYKTFGKVKPIIDPKHVTRDTKDSDVLSAKNYTFHLTIEKEGEKTKFIIEKFQEKKSNTLYSRLAFYNNSIDFSEVLKLIRTFVYNPELVFITYGEVMKNKMVLFSNDEIDSAIMEDHSLDKPFEKVIK